MVDISEISKRLYRQLDSFGYNIKMAAIRKKHWRKMAALIEIKFKTKLVYVGSKGEGISKFHESDKDVLVFFRLYTCFHEIKYMRDVPEETNVFLAVNTSPGYCVLESVKNGRYVHVDISMSLVPFNDKIYLSSEQIMTTTSNTMLEARAEKEFKEVKHTEITGPAFTSTCDYFGVEDGVRTFSCECYHILLTWAQRERLHDWPPLAVRQNVPKMYGILVATGRKGSPTCHLEWRYCFNEVELLLTETLNDTQMKLYTMLKIINNDILKTSGFSLSSFMVKNVVYWISETRLQSTFVPEMLFQWVIEALKMLEHAADTNKLAYYMIPERNLFTEVKETDRLPLKAKITEIIGSGPAFLLQCKSLNLVMSLTPLELRTMQHKMECLEMGFIYCSSRMAEELIRNPLPVDKAVDKALEDELLSRLIECILSVLYSGWPDSVQREILACQDPDKAFKLLLG